MELKLNGFSTSELAEKPARGAQVLQVLLGLLQALILVGCIQVLLLPFVQTEADAKVYFSFGLTQFLYTLPLARYYYRRNEKQKALGVALGAALILAASLPWLDDIHGFHYITTPCHCT